MRNPFTRPFEAADEWLETDGLGGFALGTVGSVRTRRYHGLLVAATRPPAGRTMLLSGVEAWVRTPTDEYPLTSHRYLPNVIHPGGALLIDSFQREPWPRWVFALPDGTRLSQELFLRHGEGLLVLSWRLLSPAPGVTLHVRPLLAPRDYHALHRENTSCDATARHDGDSVSWQPYASLPGVRARSNGTYRHDPHWYRNFLYEEERERGFDCVEDTLAPGELTFDLSGAEALLVAGPTTHAGDAPSAGQTAVDLAHRLREAEAARRGGFASPLHRAADAYIVRRGDGLTIIAGYPWFADWGRDTFIALRGLCLATGRFDDARRILLQWAGVISQGMIPNRFVDEGEGEPEYNSVDASLWFIVAADALLREAEAGSAHMSRADRHTLHAAMLEILSAYACGTRYGVHADADGLLAAGEPGQQLTWMDARVHGREVTPRIGKPVEVNALWISALAAGARVDTALDGAVRRAQASFEQRFWNASRGCLFDVVDVDHRPGACDDSIRPNQILAVGGLPHPLLSGSQARSVVNVIERDLWTPLGLRSLAPNEPGYVARYEGPPDARDGAYHQGTVWPWLIGPFIEAWVRVRGSTESAKGEARTRFLSPLLEHLNAAGLGHVSEIADGEPPHTPRGCPFQAWSVAEVLRVDQLLAPRDAARSGNRPAAAQAVTG